MIPALRDISLFEIEIASELDRFSSLRCLARAKHISVAQASKTIRKLEERLECELIQRCTSGYSLSPNGHAVNETAKRLHHQLGQLVPARMPSLRTRAVLTLGARPFLNVFLAPLLCKSPVSAMARFRFVDMSPEDLKQAESANAIDMAVYLGDVQWTRAWSARTVGYLEWRTYARAGHPLLAEGVAERDVLEADFVCPAYWVGREIKEGDDHFPVPLHRRRRGDECQSALAAIRIAANSDQLAFVPGIAARELESRGEVVAFPNGVAPRVSQTVWLAVRSQHIAQRLFKEMYVALESFFTPDVNDADINDADVNDADITETQKTKTGLTGTGTGTGTGNGNGNGNGLMPE